MDKSKKIYVYADWEFLDKTQLMGILFVEISRGKEIYSFEYDESWLKSGKAQVLDPDLRLYKGRQYISDNSKNNFGIFLDSCPDRWGSNLMLRRENAIAKKEKRKPKTLLHSDYLLGVYDEHRMGAIRFKENTEGPFLNNDSSMPAPPWTSIRELEEVTKKLESDEAVDNLEYNNWLNLIIAPGSSLGGARPKASVIDREKSLWIAKFPSKNDQTDIGAWEMAVNDMAQTCGINIAHGKAIKFASDYHTFLTKRFDRTQNGSRIHFASAMTLLGYIDDHDNKGNISYLEIADFISINGARVNEDLEELWRRIVFNIAISNTDDHLRNHGFSLLRGGFYHQPMI